MVVQYHAVALQRFRTHQLLHGCEEQEHLQLICLSWGYLGLFCLSVFAWFQIQYGWQGMQIGRLYFYSRWEVCASRLVHKHSPQPFAWLPWLTRSLVIFSGCVPYRCPPSLYRVSQPSLVLGLHMVQSLKVLKLVGCISFAITAPSSMIQSHFKVSNFNSVWDQNVILLPLISMLIQ